MAHQLDFLEILERPSLEQLLKPDEIFNSNDASFLTTLPESTVFDRKSPRIQSQQLAECLSAFGNGPAVQGGVVAIGIENNGRVTGCKDVSESKLQAIEYMGRDHCPDGKFSTRRVPVKNDHGEDDFIVLSRIDYIENRLVELTNGDAFCRESDNSRRLTETEKQEARINKGERAFELEPCGLNYPDDFRTPDMARFAKQIRTARDGSPDLTDEQILESMRLGRHQSGKFVPNNACALIFAKDPQLVFPGAYIHFLRYNGVIEGTGKEYNVIKDRIISGTILDVIKEASTTLDANLREFTSYQNGKFFTVPEYPHDAWYEVIVNAVIHRSYHAKNQPIFIKMFDDRLVVESPGAFMPNVSPENFFHKPRNPFLMFVLREFGEVRCISEGTARIVREISEANLPTPEFIGTTHSVVVRLHNDVANRTNSLDSEAYKMLGEALAFSLDPDERKIVNYVIEHSQLNVSDALRILSTTYWHTAKAKLQRLVDRGILDFISTKHRDPKAYYTLRKDTSSKS